MSSAKWRPFCLGLNVLKQEFSVAENHYSSHYLDTDCSSYWQCTLFDTVPSVPDIAHTAGPRPDPTSNNTASSYTPRRSADHGTCCLRAPWSRDQGDDLERNLFAMLRNCRCSYIFRYSWKIRQQVQKAIKLIKNVIKMLKRSPWNSRQTWRL